MAGRIVLISDDPDFFEYIRQKLELRKSDELFTFPFDSVPEKLQLIDSAVLVVNSENAEDKTLDLLKLLQGTPVIVFAYNEDEVFRRKCYRAGIFDFMTILTPDAEFRARIIPALTISSILEKNKQYREILILDNIRRNDILMSYAPNKYFLLMYDTGIKSAETLWEKIGHNLPQKLYAGFVNISNQKRQQLINEALNKLHSAINNDKNIPVTSTINGIESYTNFKQFRQEFGKKFEQIITPVFYQIQQKYSGKLAGISLQQEISDGLGVFYIKGKISSSSFRITCPGFSKINIDITFQKNQGNIDAKRITLEPDEFEAGLLEDLLEQFILEYKRGTDYD